MQGDDMTTIAAWFTPARRKAIYATLAALGVLVQTIGLLDAVTVAHWLDVASQALAVGGLVLATVNTDTSTPTGMPAAPAAYSGDSKADATYHDPDGV
jgi:hypothetical protein